VDGDPKTALSLYKEVFSLADPFSVDLVNAARCATEVDSLDLAIGYIRELIVKGVVLNYLETFPGFDTLRSTDAWKALLASFDSLSKTREFNSALRQRLDSLEALDQEFRQASGGYVTYGDTIAQIDKNNIQEFRKIIEQFGFPNERILGVQYPGISVSGAIVLHHHCQSISLDTTDKYRFEHDFYDAVRRGELDPHTMTRFLSLQGAQAPVLGPYSPVRLSTGSTITPLLIEIVPENRIEEVRQNRRNIGLEDVEAFRIKANFALNDPKALFYNFKRYAYYETWPVDQTTFEKIRQFFKPLAG
jgi:hypothetical protein